MNVEGTLVAAYNAEPTLPDAFMEVPTPRPARFILVERIGGGRVDVRDRPLVSIQWWDESRWRASEGADLVAQFTRSLSLSHPQVARVTIESIYNNPDPASEQARYQVNATIITA